MSSSPSTTPTHRHPHLSTAMLLDRALSARRGSTFSDDEDDAVTAAADDESKTKKHQHFFFLATNRASHHLSRFGSGAYCVCALAFLFILFLFSSFLFSSRGFVCISSSYSPVSRAGFFGFDGLESDFGALGVPWCECHYASDLICLILAVLNVIWGFRCLCCSNFLVLLLDRR